MVSAKQPEELPTSLPAGTRFKMPSGNIYMFTEPATLDAKWKNWYEGPYAVVHTAQPRALATTETMEVEAIDIDWGSYREACRPTPLPRTLPAGTRVTKRVTKNVYEFTSAAMTVGGGYRGPYKVVHAEDHLNVATMSELFADASEVDWESYQKSIGKAPAAPMPTKGVGPYVLQRTRESGTSYQVWCEAQDKAHAAMLTANQPAPKPEPKYPQWEAWSTAGWESDP